ncbi:MAG: RsmB/NOP family class I SAM-dependent RNA methyltransferase [Pseudomonadota bacterium]
MTPPARLAAAADILDAIAGSKAAEQVLTTWARQNRYAGSKDRAAIRDHVYDVIRQWRSLAARGGGESGRALTLGLLRASGEDPDAWFTGVGHAPHTLSDAERATGRAPTAEEALDLPEWLLPMLRDSLGDALGSVAAALAARADLFLRWHAGRTDAARAIAALAEDGVVAEPHPMARTALRVTEGARRVHLARAYRDGLVEIQDVASQAVAEALPVPPGVTVLDYCAGGGGKALALAARGARVVAHDADPRRMADLAPRAARAGTPVETLATAEVPYRAPFELVVLDVPCSGSGAWRRQPDAKWRLTPERLAALTEIQTEILNAASGYVTPGGHLAYITCSILPPENTGQIDRFLAAQGKGFTPTLSRRFLPGDGGDGFFLCLMRANA